MKYLKVKTGAFALALCALAAAFAAPASAAEATGCSGAAVSSGTASATGEPPPGMPFIGHEGLPSISGQVLDAVSAPGPGGTEPDPFTIDLTGDVAWRGETTSVISPGTWSVSVGGVPMSGSFTNSDHKRSAEGTYELGDLPPAVKSVLQGKPKVLVTGDVTGSGGTCQFSLWVQLNGSVLASPVFWTGAGFSLFGLLLLTWMFLGTKAVPVAGGAVQGFAPSAPPGGPPPGGPPTPPSSGGAPQ